MRMRSPFLSRSVCFGGSLDNYAAYCICAPSAFDSEVVSVYTTSFYPIKRDKFRLYPFQKILCQPSHRAALSTITAYLFDKPCNNTREVIRKNLISEEKT